MKIYKNIAILWLIMFQNFPHPPPSPYADLKLVTRFFFRPKPTKNRLDILLLKSALWKNKNSDLRHLAGFPLPCPTPPTRERPGSDPGAPQGGEAQSVILSSKMPGGGTPLPGSDPGATRERPRGGRPTVWYCRQKCLEEGPPHPGATRERPGSARERPGPTLYRFSYVFIDFSTFL